MNEYTKQAENQEQELRPGTRVRIVAGRMVGVTGRIRRRSYSPCYVVDYDHSDDGAIYSRDQLEML